MGLVVVTGPPCAGKSTYVEVNRGQGDVVVDYDAIARALGAASHLPDGHIREAAFAARGAAITYVLEHGADAWVIHTSPRAEDVARYEAAGAVFVQVDPGMEECLARAEADGRPAETAGLIRDYYAAAGRGKGRGAVERKSVVVAFKADGDTEGRFTGYASTWTREPDCYGDVVAKGAFARTLKEWEAKGQPIPVLWSHDMSDPFAFIGTVDEATEDEHGLKVAVSLDLDNPKAAQVHRLLRRGAVAQMSFAFDVAEDATVTLEDGRKARELRDVSLYEVSVVPLGANQDTSIDDVKTAAETHLTAREVAALRALLAAESASEEEEADDNAGDTAEAAEGGNAKSRAEAVARITEQINAL
nr:HK97 family phage prohead protease [Actinomyces sp.]